MADTKSSNVDLIRDYLSALEVGKAGDALAPYFTPDALQT